MPEFIVGGVVGDKQSLLVSGGGPANNPSASDGGLDDGDEGAEFALEDGVEVVGASSCNEAVAVGKFGKDTNIVGILILYPVRHELLYLLL